MNNTKTHWGIILCLFVGIAPVFAQSKGVVAVLQNEEEISDPVKQCSLYLEIGNQYIEEWDIEAASQQYRLALQLARQIPSPLMEARSLSYLGAAHFNASDQDSAILFFQEAIKGISNDSSKELLEESSSIYFQLGIVYKVGFSDIKKALKYFILALKFAEKTQNTELIIEAYLGLAMVYYDFEYSKGDRYAKKGLELAKKHKNWGKVAEFQSLIGGAIANHKQMDELERGQQLLHQSIKYFKKNNDNFEAADNQLVLSRCFLLSENLDSATYYAQIGYRQFKELGYESALVSAALDLAEVYSRKRAYAKVISLLLPFLSSDQIKENPEISMLFYELLTKSYESLGDTKQALALYKTYKAASDSLLKKNQSEELSNLRVKFNANWLEKEQKILQQKNEALNALNTLYFWMGILLLSFFIAIVWAYRKVKRNNALIKNQKAALEQLNHTKDRLFGIIGHDLRSPLLSLSGIAQKFNYLLQKNRVEDIRKLGFVVESSLQQVKTLTDNLLNWSMIEQKQFPHHPETIKVAEIMEEVISVFQNAADAKKIELSLHIEKGLQLWVDYNALATILRNLVGNAIKFTHTRGRVTFSAIAQNAQIILKIQDTGIGISPERLSNLFQFRGMSKTGTSGERGSGFGLPLCKELMELNGGKISVESIENEGTTFFLIFPTSHATTPT